MAAISNEPPHRSRRAWLRRAAATLIVGGALVTGGIALRAHPEPAPAAAKPERKSLIIAGSTVRYDGAKPITQVRVEIAYGSEVKPEDVDSIILVRIAVDDVRPMRDH